MRLNYFIFAIPLPFINYYLRQNKLINMFHVLKWADISLNNPLKNKKNDQLAFTKNFVKAN
jgi:hypothetical protein